MGSRPHRRVRGPVAGPPLRRARAAAPRSREPVRRVRDAARGAWRDRGARAGAGQGVHGAGQRSRRRGARRARARRRRPLRDGAAPRAAAHRDDAPGDGAGRPAVRRGPGEHRGAARSARRPRGLDRGARGIVRDGRRRGGLRLRQRAPATQRRAARVSDRPPPRQQRQLAALQRGRRLRAARVVVARGLGVEGGARHHPSCERRHGPSGGARMSRLLVRGRRLRPRAQRASAHRGRVGEGGDLDPADGRRSRRRRARVGVDVLALLRLSRLRPVSLPRVLAGVLRRATTASCAAARGRPTRVSPASRSATGTCRSDARSSLVSAWQRRSDGAVRIAASAHARDDPHRLAPRRHAGALARRRRARRAHAPVQGAAAQALLRRARRRAVRPHLRSARVLPHAHRARDPRAARRGARRAHGRRRAGRARLRHRRQDARAARRAAGRRHARALHPRGRHREHGARLRAGAHQRVSRACACTA